MQKSRRRRPSHYFLESRVIGARFDDVLTSADAIPRTRALERPENSQSSMSRQPEPRPSARALSQVHQCSPVDQPDDGAPASSQKSRQQRPSRHCLGAGSQPSGISSSHLISRNADGLIQGRPPCAVVRDGGGGEACGANQNA